MLGAVVVSLLAAPFAAAAVGTGVHDAVYTEQSQARHAVAATVTVCTAPPLDQPRHPG
ncbi:MAG TPA: hypothetical protein VLU24_05750 [Mycobacterium sp.]|nr:hypothetical protein [Mycobacterium sp.]